MKTIAFAVLLLSGSAQAQTNLFGNPWDQPWDQPRNPAVWTPQFRPMSPPPVYSVPVYTPPRTLICNTIPIGGGQTTTICN